MRTIAGAAVVIALAAIGVFALWASHPSPRLPQPPGPVRDLASWLGIAPSADLPDDWTLERQPPKEAAVLGVNQPVGALPAPLQHKEALAAWQAWRDGRYVDAAKQAEVVWPTLNKAGKGKAEPTSEEDRLRFAFLLTQTRLYTGDKAGALAAARIAAGHPGLGVAALRWLTTRADDAGLSQVVLALASDRSDGNLALLRAKALRRNGNSTEAQRILADLNPAPGTALWRRWMIERARALAAAGQDDAAMEAARDMLRKARKSQASEEMVDWLIGGSDSVWQKRLQKRASDAPAVLDALVYTAQRRRYPRAIPAFEALAALDGVGLPVQCHARSWAARSHDRKAAFDKALPHYEWLRGHCNDDAVRALVVDEDGLGKGDLAFRTGRALALQGKAEGGKWLQTALDQGLTGLDADDAKTLLLALKDKDALPILEKQGPIAAADYAEKDMIDVAVWRVALERLIDKRFKDALPLLDRLAEVRDRGEPDSASEDAGRYDDRDWGRGRADYFAGRALAELGKAAEAQARWQRVIKRHPLSYYAQMSVAQLQAHAPKGKIDLEALTGAGRKLEAGPQLDEATLADARVQRGRLLGQLGWHDEAGEELDAAGLGRDPGPDARWAAGDPGKTWSRAALDAEAGRWVASHAVGRDVLRAYATAWPTDANREAWKIAFPRGYQTLMDAAAQEFDLHPSILYAICRSESGFNPRVESHAHAFGLLQLIIPTAEAMAKGLNVTANAETLRQPAVNVRLGARYLKKLLDRFDREQQMAAGYNAGGGAVGRWRKQRGDWPMDLFVETIPFRETRDYAKRVTSAIATYRALYHGEKAYALALTQKSVPTAEEAPTEPPSKPGDSGQAPPAPADAQVAAMPAKSTPDNKAPDNKAPDNKVAADAVESVEAKVGGVSRKAPDVKAKSASTRRVAKSPAKERPAPHKPAASKAAATKPSAGKSATVKAKPAAAKKPVKRAPPAKAPAPSHNKAKKKR